MRVSCSYDDPGYAAFASLLGKGEVVVTLDGREQTHVVTADEEEGLILRHVLNASGQAQIDPNDHNQVWCEVVRGAVHVGTRVVASL